MSVHIHEPVRTKVRVCGREHGIRVQECADVFIPEAEGPGLCLPGQLCDAPTAGAHARSPWREAGPVDTAPCLVNKESEDRPTESG